jgi:alkyl sulfatase BDS1-like metallo-beta-lactamase superfamily hydrolase
MGGLDAVLALARKAFDAGDYRWAATLLDHAVFVDEHHAAVRELYADTLEQLGYGAENGTWRNFFLSGATELREGGFGTPADASAPSMVAQLTPEQLFAAMAISVDGPAAWDLDLAVDVTLTDLDRSYRLTLRNGVLIARPAKEGQAPAAASVSLTKLRLVALLGGDATSPGVDVTGDPGSLQSLVSVLKRGDPDFAIVTP